MLGGNPQHERFGFRFWQDPGAFAELYRTGPLGRFCGFLQCFILASFTVAGPDYVSMAAGEAENPRVVLPSAFKQVFGRLMAFFVLGSLAVGINVPYNDRELNDAFNNDAPGAAASPYVVAMNRLKIPVLPDIGRQPPGIVCWVTNTDICLESQYLPEGGNADFILYISQRHGPSRCVQRRQQLCLLR